MNRNALHNARIVFCRIGSLKMNQAEREKGERVFCHIGSLESPPCKPKTAGLVFCRIGSLEKFRVCRIATCGVFCRIGSLETPARGTVRGHWRFLPHRQLRTCSQSVRGRKQRGLGWAAALQTSRRAARPACGLRLTVHPGSRSCAPHGQIMNRF